MNRKNLIRIVIILKMIEKVVFISWSSFCFLCCKFIVGVGKIKFFLENNRDLLILRVRMFDNE